MVLMMYSKVAAKESILYTYNRCINGFAAVLDDKEVTALASKSPIR